MAVCPDRIIDLMHDYLDGDINSREEQTLKQHLQTCEKCQQHYHELTKTAALIQSTSHLQAPPDFVARTLSGLPKEKTRVKSRRWLQAHPFLVSAAVFLLLMSTLLFSNFNNEQHFSFTKQPNVIVEGEMVIVPEGEVVTGNLTVRNGDLRIEGEVQGDVTVINGSAYMASTGIITGSSEEIDQAFEWLWYTIKTEIRGMMSIFEEEGIPAGE
ncbi:anti-sigma factor family protein [Planococcus lenghuensis]|uniref:Anti-sigma-W factor RsiW n=1 Tax=Planococcus lenghuensis TaxID=2213202 RepID=A0A1Q2KUM7_9BACL|nr:anti-sigma factor [Planococcus lenghuensis]AQQ51824.1 anti-sigma factor [Planococcus lenghuensis]